MTETPTPYHNYRLSKGHFQTGSDAMASSRIEVHRLDVETDKAFHQRIEILISAMRESAREGIDDPSFRVVVVHGVDMATITVEVLHGEPVSFPPSGPDQGNESPPDDADTGGGDQNGLAIRERIHPAVDCVQPGSGIYVNIGHDGSFVGEIVRENHGNCR